MTISTRARRLGLTSLLGVLALSVLLTPAHAFDGKRKGFVLGFGFGFAPVATWSSDDIRVDISEVGVSVNILVGYAWDNRNMIAYEGNGTGYETSDLNKSTVIQALNGAYWYHYWGKSDRQVFTVAALGLMRLSSEYRNVCASGFGYGAGVGYEVFKQVQIGLYYFGGWTDNDYDVKASHAVVNLLVTVVAY